MHSMTATIPVCKPSPDGPALTCSIPVGEYERGNAIIAEMFKPARTQTPRHMQTNSLNLRSTHHRPRRSARRRILCSQRATALQSSDCPADHLWDVRGTTDRSGHSRGQRGGGSMSDDGKIARSQPASVTRTSATSCSACSRRRRARRHRPPAPPARKLSALTSQAAAPT